MKMFFIIPHALERLIFEVPSVPYWTKVASVFVVIPMSTEWEGTWVMNGVVHCHTARGRGHPGAV